MSETMPLQPEQTVARGRFVLAKRLGRGGMGVVWLARDQRLHEEVALKFLPAEISADAVALDDLRRETARSHKLSHPNIVRIHDLYEDPDGTAFIVMEYIDGWTLSAIRLEQPSRVLPWDYLRPLVAQLCAALEHAHGEKVIHRDLKPANLMVDSRGRLKLADFGIAAVASDSTSRLSMRHSTSGTLPYMSPQQLTGQRPQAADDIYALGATLYELLTGKPPFYTGNVTHQVLHEAPEPMQDRLAALEIQNDIPPDAASLVMACLGKEPGQRPQSARVVAEWIGLELEVKPSAERLAAALFAQEPPIPAPLAAGKRGGKGLSKPARLGRNLTAIGIVVLVMAAAFWLRKDVLRRDNSNPSVPYKGPDQIEPPVKSNPPPVPPPPEPPARGAGVTTIADTKARTSNATALPGIGLNEDESWTFTTIAGKAGSSGSTDGVGGNARFHAPSGIAVDKEGNLYVCDSYNDTIRRITPSGIVSTLAGRPGISGSRDGLGANALLTTPHRIALDGSGNAYVTELTNYTIRKITPAGMVTTLAGRAGSIGSTDGPAAIARFNVLNALAVAPNGDILVADGGNSTIRRMTPTGLVSTVAGQAGVVGSLDGPVSSARFNTPSGLAVGAGGVIYVTCSNNTIRVIHPNGMVSTLAGKPGVPGSADGTVANARFNNPFGIQEDGEGNLYIADENNHTIRKITRAGAVSTIGGLAGQAGSSDGAGAVARFNWPGDVAFDAQGNIYLTDPANNNIRKGVCHPAQQTAILTTTAAANPPATADWRRGLVLYFSFDEPPKNGVVRDESGSGNDGRAVNVQWTAQGRRGGAVQFSRMNSYITVSNRPSLNPEQITVAAWIKTRYADNVYRRIFDKGCAEGFALSEGGEFQQWLQQGQLLWQIGFLTNKIGYITNSDHAIHSTGKRMDDGLWHHLAATYDGAVQRFYMDAQLFTNILWQGRILANNYDLTIGANRSNPERGPAPGEVGASFDGLMDEVMMFNRALSPDEVRQLYELPSAPSAAAGRAAAPANAGASPAGQR